MHTDEWDVWAVSLWLVSDYYYLMSQPTKGRLKRESFTTSQGFLKRDTWTSRTTCHRRYLENPPWKEVSTSLIQFSVPRIGKKEHTNCCWEVLDHGIHLKQLPSWKPDSHIVGGLEKSAQSLSTTFQEEKNLIILWHASFECKRILSTWLTLPTLPMEIF